MGEPWRTRCLVDIPVDISTQDFQFDGVTVRSRPDLRHPQMPDRLKVIDTILTNYPEKSAEAAHVIGVDSTNVFLERIALAAYGPCSVVKIVSTCPLSVDPLVDFDLVTHDLSVRITGPTIQPEDIDFGAEANARHVREAMQHARIGLAETNADIRLLHLHIAAERIALAETDERVSYSCPECGHTWDGPPASKRAVTRLLQHRGVSDEDCRDAVSFRARVAHGGGRRDVAFYERATELAGAIQGAVIPSILERAGACATRRFGAMVGFPMSTHRARKYADGSFDIVTSEWKAPIRFVKLDEDVSEPEGSSEVGCPTDDDVKPIIDPAAWPT